MANIQFLNNIDLAQNQLVNARVHVNGTAPAGSGKGSIWLNSTTNELNFHNGTTFVSVLDDTTIANTQNVFTSSFVDSTDDVILRLTKSGASSGTQDIKFVAGSNVTLTPSGTNLTIASTQKSDSTIRGLLSASGVLSYNSSTGAFTSSAEANVDTNLGKTTATGQITITSSTGNNVVISEATGSIAGLMSTTHHDKLDGIEASATADQTASEIRTLLGTGNGNLVPSAGSSGQFLKHDGTFGTPSYIANTTTGAQMTEATLRTKLGSITENVTIGDATDVQVTIAGNLVVSGTTTTVNSTTVNLNDHNIVLDSGNSTSAVVDGGGITLEGGSGDDATFTYNTTGPKFELKLGSSYEDLKVDTLHAATLNVTNYNLASNDIPDNAADTSGEAGTAVALATSRNFRTNLGSTSTDGFTGAANCNPGVTGTLEPGNGGTGLTSISTLVNSNTTASNVGLGNVTNESKSNMFSGAALTNNPTAPTQSTGNNSTRIATTAFVSAATAGMGVGITKKLTGVNNTLTYTMTHNFGTPHVITQVLHYGSNGSEATYDVVHVNVRRSSDNAVSVVFGNTSVVGANKDFLVMMTKMPDIS